MLNLTVVLTLLDRCIQPIGLLAVLYPIKQRRQGALRPAAIRLVRAVRAVRRARDEVQTIPVVQGVGGLVKGEGTVHRLADGFVVVHGRAGGDTGVGFAVDVDDLAAVGVERGQVGPGGLEDVFVALPAQGHPVRHDIVGDVVEGGEVIDIAEFEELGDPFAAQGGDVEFPGVGVGVVFRFGVVEGRAGLVPDVSAFAVEGLQAVEDLGGDGGAFFGDGAVLSWGGVAGGEALLEHGGSGFGGTVVGGADGGVNVEVQLAEVGAGDDAVLFAVEGVAGGDGQVVDLLEFAGRGVVAHGVFDETRVEVVGLLLAVADGRGADDSAIPFLAEALDLGPALAATFGAALVVGVELGGAEVEEVLGEGLADSAEFVVGLVAEHVEGLAVNGAVGLQEDGVEFGGEATETTVSLAGGSSIHDTAGQVSAVAVDGIAETTGGEPAVLEVGWGREPELQQDLVIEPVVGVGQSDVAEVEGGGRPEGRGGGAVVVDRVGCDGSGVHGDAHEGAAGGHGTSIGGCADIRQAGRLGKRKCGRAGQKAHLGAHCERVTEMSDFQCEKECACRRELLGRS